MTKIVKAILISILDTRIPFWRYEVELNVVNKWPGAFQGELILTNTSDKPLENWTLAFHSDHETTKVHDIKLWHYDSNLKYPNIVIIQ